MNKGQWGWFKRAADVQATQQAKRQSISNWWFLGSFKVQLLVGILRHKAKMSFQHLYRLWLGAASRMPPRPLSPSLWGSARPVHAAQPSARSSPKPTPSDLPDGAVRFVQAEQNFHLDKAPGRNENNSSSDEFLNHILKQIEETIKQYTTMFT